MHDVIGFDIQGTRYSAVSVEIGEGLADLQPGQAMLAKFEESYSGIGAGQDDIAPILAHLECSGGKFQELVFVFPNAKTEASSSMVRNVAIVVYRSEDEKSPCWVHKERWIADGMSQKRYRFIAKIE